MWLYDVPSTFMGVFVDGRVVQGCAIHVFGGFCGRKGGFVVCRPRLGVFLWTGGWFCGMPSTFWAFLWPGVWFCGVPSTFRGVFVAGSVVLWCIVHVYGGFCGWEG